MLLLTAGDKEISTALADGMLAVRGTVANSLSHAARASSLREGALTKEQREMVSAEMDRQRIAERLRNEMHPEPVDYAAKAFDAEDRYGESLYEPGVWEKVGKAMLVVYALAVLGFERLFRTVGT